MSGLPFSDLSQRLAQPTADVWSSHYEALERRARGEDVIVLSVGDPDFATPPNITQRLVDSIQSGRTHYSPAAGEEELRNAIAELETAATGKTIGSDHFVIFPGATAALHGVLACVLNPGDGVVVPEPMYIGYQPIMASLGVNIQPVALDAFDFSLDIDHLKSAVDDTTRAVLLNTPGNPCGNLLPREQLEELARFTRTRNLWLICDEVYSLITFETPHVSLLKCTDDYSNIAVVDGLSKSHAMSGWRVGWVAADGPLAGTLANYAAAVFFGCSQFVQDAAAEALKTDERHVETMRFAYQRRRDLVAQALASVTNLRVVNPAGGMFVMVEVSRVEPGMTGTRFAAELLAATGVSVLPGAGFGPTAANMVRLSLSQPDTVLAAALGRIIGFCRGRMNAAGRQPAADGAEIGR